MMNSSRMCLYFCFFILIAPLCKAKDKPRQWTIMVYLNGKNNLESDLLGDFLEMTNVAWPKSITIVAELGRPKQHWDTSFGPWSGVRRFLVRQGLQPRAHCAIEMLGNVDMASGATLRSFVKWAQRRYPAQHYMLVIASHGQGFRLETAFAGNAQSFPVPEHSLQGLEAFVNKSAISVPPPNGYRWGSYDEDFGHFLYNRDIEDSLSDLPSRFDIISFDACLMQTLEMSFALRNISQLMIASEELEPGPGWNYADIAKRVVNWFKQHKVLEPKDFANMIVAAYQQEYDDQTTGLYTTMSVIDLRMMPEVARRADDLSTTLINKIAVELPALHTSRMACIEYGNGLQIYAIDFECFLKSLGQSSRDSEIRAETKDLLDSLVASIITNYADKRTPPSLGSHGIAIYFPKTRDDFQADPFHEGYEKRNSCFPVEFVQAHRWADFLSAYWKNLIHPAAN